MLRRSKIAVGILALAVVGLLALQTHILTAVRGYAWNLLTSVTGRIFNISPLDTTPDAQHRLEYLLVENIRLKAQEQEYVHLKEQLGSVAFTSFRPINGEVQTRTLDTFHTQFIINRGRVDGVSEGAPVVVYGGALVGFITEVHEQTSVVQLLLHPTTSLSVQVQQESTPRGLLVGRHYISLAVTTIPRDAVIEPGQDVVTVARENLPAGLLVGKIKTVQRTENEAYQEAALQLPYDPDQLQAVTVLVLP